MLILPLYNVVLNLGACNVVLNLDAHCISLCVLFIQVYIGNYRPSSLTQVQPVQDLSGIKVGQLVAVFNEDKETEPWIGRLEDIFEETVSIVWMEGGYTNTAKIADPTNRRKN